MVIAVAGRAIWPAAAFRAARVAGYVETAKETKAGVRPGSGRLNLDDEVKLKYYRLQKISEGRILLDPGRRGALDAPTDVGTGRIEDEQLPFHPSWTS